MAHRPAYENVCHSPRGSNTRVRLLLPSSSTRGDPRPSGRSSCAVIAPLCFGSRDPRASPRRDPREVLPSAGGRRVPDVIGSVVVSEVALPLPRHLAKNPDVRVAHVPAPPGSGTGFETAIAWGSSCGRSSGPTSRKPNVRSRSAMSCGGSPHSGQAVKYAPAAGVNRSRQRGQQGWVMSAIPLRSCLASRGRMPGKPGSSQGRGIGHRPARSTPGVARGRTRAERARTRGSCRSTVDQVGVPG
jgi:hypothetical protein